MWRLFMKTLILLITIGLSFTQVFALSVKKEIVKMAILQASIKVTLSDKAGMPKHFTCTLLKGTSRAKPETTNSNKQGKEQSRIFLLDANSNTEVWSYQLEEWPLSYDFTVSDSEEGTAIAFVRFNKIEFLFPLIQALDPSSSQPSESIDLFKLYDKELFEGGVNALAFNIRLKKIYFDKTWYIEIVGDKDKTFKIKRLEKNKWMAVSP